MIMSLVLAASALTMPTALSAFGGDNCCNPNPCCDNSWDGLYVGLNAGVGSLDSHRIDQDGYIFQGGHSTIETAFVGGVQAGWDTQCDNLVLGVVGDFNWNNYSRTLCHNGDEVDSYVKGKVDWTSSIRLRVGVPVCDTLIYLTGGAAVAKLKTHWYLDSESSHHHHDTRWGWIGGVGLEHKVGCNLSLGVEFLCSHFENTSSRHQESSLEDVRFCHGANSYVGRVTLNYRFGDLCSLW